MLVEAAAVTLDSRVKPENDGGVTGVLIAVGFAL